MTDQFTPHEAAVIRQAWASIRPILAAAAAALTPTQDDYALVPNDVAAAAVIPARRALAACLDGDDQHAAELLAVLDADQLYAIEGAASGLAIHASRLRKPLDPAEQPDGDRTIDPDDLAPWERDLLERQAAQQQAEPAQVRTRADLAAELRAAGIDRDQWRDRAHHWKATADTAEAALDYGAARLYKQLGDAVQRAETAERRAEHFEEHAAQVNADLGIEMHRADTAERRLDEMRDRAQRAEADAADWREVAGQYEAERDEARARVDALGDEARLLATDLAQERRAAETYRRQRDAARKDAETEQRRRAESAERQLAEAREQVAHEIRTGNGASAYTLRRILTTLDGPEPARDGTSDPDAWRP